MITTSKLKKKIRTQGSNRCFLCLLREYEAARAVSVGAKCAGVEAGCPHRTLAVTVDHLGTLSKAWFPAYKVRFNEV